MTTSQIGMGGPQFPKGTEGPRPRGPKGMEEAEKAAETASSATSFAETSEETPAVTPNMDTYVPSSSTEETTSTEDEGVTYTPNKKLVNQLKAELAVQTQSFINDMVSMITGQAGSSLTSSGILDAFASDYEVTPEMQAEAEEAISEDGYWGVEQTANRIFDMAQALTGGDPSKADAMMEAIEEGFAAAEKAWGGELPSITSDTKSRIDELFAEWKGE